MVEVAVRQEDPVEPSEACAAQQQLTLGTLAAGCGDFLSRREVPGGCVRLMEGRDVVS